ncbi:MAG: hypothetical protein J6R82_07320 [Clostridia bacterium]|nr:hypothetical protein [Clostridia bacterium]
MSDFFDFVGSDQIEFVLTFALMDRANVFSEQNRTNPLRSIHQVNVQLFVLIQNIRKYEHGFFEELIFLIVSGINTLCQRQRHFVQFREKVHLFGKREPIIQIRREVFKEGKNETKGQNRSTYVEKCSNDHISLPDEYRDILCTSEHPHQLEIAVIQHKDSQCVVQCAKHDLDPHRPYG